MRHEFGHALAIKHYRFRKSRPALNLVDSAQLVEAGLALRQEQVSVHPQVGVDAGVGFKPPEPLERETRKGDVGRVGELVPETAGGAPRRPPSRQRTAVNDDYIADSRVRQVKGDRGPDDSAADDSDAGPIGHGLNAHTCRMWRSAGDKRPMVSGESHSAWTCCCSWSRRT